MQKKSYYMVNSLTLYRLIAAPILLLLTFSNRNEMFKWLLAFSFFTDAVDGFLARKFKAASTLGASLDSLADDLTVAVAIIGIYLLRPGFIYDQITIIIPLLILYIAQAFLAVARYGKMSSFHTYQAKLATILQGIFLILFFFKGPILHLFYVTALITAIDLVEEIILVFVLPKWQVNVKGLYWLMKSRSVQTF
jgi:phosphatidylglycerophosphate synthase